MGVTCNIAPGTEISSRCGDCGHLVAVHEYPSGACALCPLEEQVKNLRRDVDLMRRRDR